MGVQPCAEACVCGAHVGLAGLKAHVACELHLQDVHVPWGTFGHVVEDSHALFEHRS